MAQKKTTTNTSVNTGTDSFFTKDSVVRGVITIAILLALYVLIRRLSGVLLPFIISFVIAYILAPIVNFFQHRCKFKNRLLSVLVTLTIVIGVLAGTMALIIPAISKQANSLSVSIKTYVNNYKTSETLSPRMNDQLQEMIQSLDIKELLSNPEVQGTVASIFSTLTNWISSGINSLAGLAVVFVCLMYIIFLLIDYEKISKNWYKYIPQRFRRSIRDVMKDLDLNMNKYFRGQALVASINGILFAIGFQIIGLPMGIGLGLLIGVLNLVPYMQILGVFPAILLGLIQSVETGRPFWVVLICIAAVFIIVQIIENLVLVPKIMGKVTGMGPAWILLSLTVWGALLGFIGMIIALPVTTILISYYKRYVLKAKLL